MINVPAIEKRLTKIRKLHLKLFMEFSESGTSAQRKAEIKQEIDRLKEERNGLVNLLKQHGEWW